MAKLFNLNLVLFRDISQQADNFRQKPIHLEKWAIAFGKKSLGLKGGCRMYPASELLVDGTNYIHVISNKLFKERDFVSEFTGEKRAADHKLLPVQRFEQIIMCVNEEPRFTEKLLGLQFESILRAHSLFNIVKVTLDRGEAENSWVQCPLDRVYISFTCERDRLIVPIRCFSVRQPHLEDRNGTRSQGEKAADKSLKVIKPATDRWLAFSGERFWKKFHCSVKYGWLHWCSEVDHTENQGNYKNTDNARKANFATLLRHLNFAPLTSEIQSSTIGKNWHFLGWLKSERPELMA